MIYRPMKYKSSLCIGYKPNIAYVYIWFSIEQSLIYIGETNDRRGVLGRAYQHVNSKGTLRERVFYHGYDLDVVSDFILLSYELPEHRDYTGIESAFRDAVEYLVQKKLKQSQATDAFVCPLCFLSRVKPTYPVSYAEPIQLAENIVSDFLKLLEESAVGIEKVSTNNNVP